MCIVGKRGLQWIIEGGRRFLELAAQRLPTQKHLQAASL